MTHPRRIVWGHDPKLRLVIDVRGSFKPGSSICRNANGRLGTGDLVTKFLLHALEPLDELTHGWQPVSRVIGNRGGEQGLQDDGYVG